MKIKSILHIGQNKEIFKSIAYGLNAVLFTQCSAVNMKEMIETKQIQLVIIDEEFVSKILIEKFRIKFPRDRVALVSYMKKSCVKRAIEILKFGLDDCLFAEDNLLQVRILKVLTNMDFLEDHIRKSRMDYLTNLHNRMSFQELAGRICMISKYENTNLCCAMIDIDHFKSINDTYGHLAGDEVIKAISSIIKTHFRKNDLICRFGGEEFMVLIHNITLSRANDIFEKLRKKIEALHVKYNDFDLNVTVSTGLYCGYDYDVLSLQSKADKLLYKAKKDGRNRVASQ